MNTVHLKRISDYIVDMLRTEVILGRLDNSIALTQNSLSQRLEVSRMPVREALRQLEQEGYLERLPNHRVRVVLNDTQDYLDELLFLLEIEMQFIQLWNNNQSQLCFLLAELPTSLSNCDEWQGREMDAHLLLSRSTNSHVVKKIHFSLLQSAFSSALKCIDRSSYISLASIFSDISYPWDTHIIRQRLLEYYNQLSVALESERRVHA